MALLVEGTKCGICGLPISNTDSVIGFGPFVSNEVDPLWQFSDTAFHEPCLLAHPLGKAALARYALVQEERLSPRVCAICRQPITNEQILKDNDFLPLDYLASDADSPLARYNLKRYHKSCLSRSPELGALRTALEVARRAGKWRGEAWESLLKTLRNLAESDRSITPPISSRQRT